MVDSYKETTKTFQAGASKVMKASAKSISVFETTIAQSAYFKLHIDALDDLASTSVLSNKGSLSGNVASLTEFMISSGDNFLPVKSINFTPVSLETTSLPLGIFGDMSIVTRRKLGKINIVLLDDNTDRFEKGLRAWYNKTVSTNGYVGYMSDIVSTLTYISYATTGEKNMTLQYNVMLADEISISRDYDSNEFKTISFNVLIVGTVGERYTG